MQPRKILFTTPFGNDYFEYFGENSSPKVERVVYPRINSYGLRFIKQNLPEIAILEFPTWEQYEQIISEDWDIVGFSFFTPDYPKVEKMAALARQKGIPELWGGSYGVLIPEAQRLFDKTIIGYAEKTIAESLGQEIPELIHPPIIDAIGATSHMQLARVGILFTSRGCPYKCTFCQTPIFCRGESAFMPLASIQRVLSYYKSINVSLVLILDETFGLSDSFSQKIVELLHHYQLPWMPMTRIDILDKNLDSWLDCGLAGALLGLENIRQQNIQTIKKKITLTTAFQVIDRLLLAGRMVIGFYMIGFENETAASIREDIRLVSNLGLDLVQVCAVTPLHGTPLWDDIQQKYGPIDPDLSKHTTKNLVWNHPSISREAMKALLAEAYEILYPHYQLEYSQSKFFNPRQLSLESLIKSEELASITFFDKEQIITEPRLSPCRILA
jgi:radical SAM superfamily enzyme YgiQ (UPF0313 family)